MRLDRFLAENSAYSRSEVKKHIKQSRVEINGSISKNTSQHINIETDTIQLDGQEISALRLRYIMLNKPKGYVCATQDAKHSSVLALLSQEPTLCQSPSLMALLEALRLQLQIVGRLDKDTTGFLLLTNDGQWNHRICSPKSHCSKTYLVELAEPLQSDDIVAFAQGLQLKDEPQTLRPAQLDIVSPHLARVTIEEGKYHQIKRMFGARGNHVTTLHREKIGDITLDSKLSAGQFRELTTNEINTLRY